MKANLIVPESLNEITLGQYQKFYKLINNNPDSEFVRQKTVSIFCNVEMKDVRQMLLSSIDEVYNGLIELFNGSPELISRFTINNIEFGLIPNFDDMSAGEFADLDDYNSDVEQWHKCMAVLYRPVTNKLDNLYEIEPYIKKRNKFLMFFYNLFNNKKGIQLYKGTEQYAETMKDTPVAIVLAVQVFFYNLSKELLIVTMDYLEQLPQSDKEIIVEKASFLENGDGIIAFMQSPKEILSKLMTQLN
jgi:hypothetical protein